MNSPILYKNCNYQNRLSLSFLNHQKNRINYYLFLFLNRCLVNNTIPPPPPPPPLRVSNPPPPPPPQFYNYNSNYPSNAAEDIEYVISKYILVCFLFDYRSGYDLTNSFVLSFLFSCYVIFTSFYKTVYSTRFSLNVLTQTADKGWNVLSSIITRYPLIMQMLKRMLVLSVSYKG